METPVKDGTDRKEDFGVVSSENVSDGNLGARSVSEVVGPVFGRGVAGLNSPVSMSGVSESSTPRGIDTLVVADEDEVPLSCRTYKRRASTSPKINDGDLPADVTESRNLRRRPCRDGDGIWPSVGDRAAVGSSCGASLRRSGFLTSKKVSPPRRYKNISAPIVISSGDETNNLATGKGRNSVRGKASKLGKKRARLDAPGLGSEDLEEIFGDVPVGPDDMVSMAASSLGVMGIEWLDELDVFRAKSLNIKGEVSGGMKTRYNKLKEVITTLVGKAEASGDPSYLRMRTTELTLELRELKGKYDKIMVELQDSKKRIKDLEKREASWRRSTEGSNVRASGTLKKLNTVGDPMDRDLEYMDTDHSTKEDTVEIVHRVLREHDIEPFNHSDSLVRRPPLKGVSSVIPTPELEDACRMTEKAKREVELSSQIDVLVEERRGIRRELVDGAKVDIVRNPLPGVSGLPPRGSDHGPRVVSDVRLAPSQPGKPPPQGSVTGDVGWRVVGGSTKRALKRARQRNAEQNEVENQTTLQMHAPLVRQPPPPGVDGDRGAVQERLRTPVMARKPSVGLSVYDSGNRVGSAPGTRTGKATPSRSGGRRIPKSAAVCIKRTDDGPSYAQMLKKAREQIQLGGLGIEDTRIRWTASGSILIEVAGKNMAEKADLFAGKLRSVLEGEATVTRPVLKGELRIWGLDDSVGTEEVTCVVADCGGCLPAEVVAGAISRMPNGLGSVWVRCPLAAAVKTAATGKLRIGWTNARVELLNARPIQCYKCWQFGHVRNACKADTDRSFACFRCGQFGHRARDCMEAAHCVVCAHAGYNANHRMGSSNCGAATANRPRKYSRGMSDRRNDVTGPVDVS